MTNDPVKVYAKRKVKKKISSTIEQWKKYWKDAGPIRFAEEFLFGPSNVPPYPDWKNLQEEYYCTGCKKKHNRFRPNGLPVHIVLSPDQKEVITDAWLNGISLILISAGRGAGKTFTLAVWDCWRLATHDFYEITCMGGSSKQSKLVQKYIDYWRGQHKEVGYIIYKSPKAIGNRGCLTRMNSEVGFIACSPTAAMGPHVNEVQIDEECAAEARGTEGMEAIEAIDWQITGRENTMIWRTSTSHFILGKFYEIMTNPLKFGYKVYIWSIAKHISGKSGRAMYTDRNPHNWKPACWWITHDDIIKLRKKSDEEWLCWALGYPSLASGQVFKPNDVKAIICDICEREGRDCVPYKWGQCKLIEKFKLGDEANPIKFIVDRKAGFDYGDPAPCALVVAGVRQVGGNLIIFILFGEEMKGLPSIELFDWIKNKMKRYKVQTFYPDPSIGGKHISEKIDGAGFAVVVLDEQAKEERVLNLKCMVERHNMVIPVAYWQLLNSMKMVHRDRRGKIKKYNDHSFDAICYVCSDWGDLEGNAQDVFDAVLEHMGLKPAVKEEDDDEGNILLTDKVKPIKFW